MKRLKALRDLMRGRRLDAFIVSRPTSIGYFTNFFDVREATNFLVVPIDGIPILFVKLISFEAAKEKAKGCDIKLVKKTEEPTKRVASELRELKAKKIAFEELSASTFIELTERLRMKLKPDPDLVWNLRTIKDEEEVSIMRKAAEIADRGLDAVMRSVRAGMNEFELAAEAEYAMRKHKCEAFAFDTIVASGPRSAIPHTTCSERKLRDGDLVLVDIGAVYHGYHSNLTRAFVIGKPSKKQKMLYDLVLHAHREALRSVKSGIPAKKVDEVARMIISKQGYGKFFVHGTGHGIGLDVHEPPYLSPESKYILKEGNVITIEPALYILKFGGIRIEDTVLVLKDKAERLTKAPYGIS